MCGIFGSVVLPGAKTSFAGFTSLTEKLFELSETRGKEAAGLACQTDDRVWVHKDAKPATQMIRSAPYKKLLDKVGNAAFGANGLKTTYLAAIGHSRLVTNGMQGIDANNQPVVRDDIVTVHNGIVVNVDDIWAANPGLTRRAQVDTEVINALLRKNLAAGDAIPQAVARLFSSIVGETSIAMLFRDFNVMVLATNTGSLYFGELGAPDQVAFVSEGYILDQLSKESGLALGASAIDGKTDARTMHDRQLRANSMLILNLATLERRVISFDEASTIDVPAYAPNLGAMRQIEDKAELDQTYRAAMRRCVRCVLPETMPFISFDADGVCNYCHHHQPIAYQGEEALERMLQPLRSLDGSPDCLVAFSGGRDSSYGLHLLKTKYGMNPVAYTYDWGLVSDLARRNQARICGKLGIEHLWVSADIKKKRANVRANVLAWMKRPELGMIPLLMAGDKQFFRFANHAMKQNALKMIVLCDNQYEKTDFKSGFANVRPAWHTDGEGEGRHYNLGSSQKAALVMYYGTQFLKNPAYLNRSVPDTISAYASYYLERNDFLPFFAYEPWVEEEVNSALIGEYDWEIAKDTTTTWRIGDSTAPFYNYVYSTVAGFNEYDTFRSNQIREGVISREAALQTIEKEAEPRWDSIREYTQLINVDFDQVLTAVNNIPRLYWPQ